MAGSFQTQQSNAIVTYPFSKSDNAPVDMTMKARYIFQMQCVMLFIIGN